MLPKRDPLQTQKCIQTESERVEKDTPCKWKPKESQSDKPYSDKIDFKIKNIKRDKEGHCIMIKGSIQEENIKIVNIYAPIMGVP